MLQVAHHGLAHRTHLLLEDLLPNFVTFLKQDSKSIGEY